MWTPGPLEIIVLLVIVLVIFGPKRLPDLGRSLGRGMREFKDSVTGKDKDEVAPESGAGEKPQAIEPSPDEAADKPAQEPAAASDRQS